MKDNQLQVILTEQNVGQENAKKLIEAFGAPFEEAGEILSTYKEIKVTGHKQVTLMQEARDKRLALKKIRTGVENRRKELKEDALKAGRAIDAVARYVKDTIQPAEDYLQLQEDFVKIENEKIAAEKKAARLERLSPLVGDTSFYNYEEMTDEQFEALIVERTEARAAAEKKRAEEAAEAKKAEEAEAKRISDQAKENARLKKEADEKAAAQKKIDAENEKKLQAEREKAAAERKKREELEAEQRRKDAVAAKEKAEAEEAEKAKLLAPDKDKLLAYAKSLGELPVPMLETEEAQAIMNNARNYVNTVAEKMAEKANTL